MDLGRLFLRNAVPVLLAGMLSPACASIFISPAPNPATWRDDVLTVQLRVQQNLIAVVTIVNTSAAKQVVPAPVLVPGSGSSYKVMNSRGDRVPTVAPDVDWGLEKLPMLELASGGVYSEAVDLRAMFPALGPGVYQLAFQLAAVAGDRATWRGPAEVPAVMFTVVR